MAMLFITHDLGVIAEIAHRVAVMYLGRIVEMAPVKEIFHHPLHPYTRALLRSVPRLGKASGGRLASIPGTVPIPIDLREACTFRDRCQEYDSGLCRSGSPPLVEAEPGHLVRCFRYQQLRLPS